MIIVIIAGGSGTRLWPLSQANYPKHLLSLTSEDSMLQNTYKRARSMTDQIYVVTEKSHAKEVANQLPDLKPENIIIEPARRGTAACIALALSVLQKRHDKDVPIGFLHADHHITNTEKFCKTVTVAANASKKHQKITLIGLEPTHPATGFGYIDFSIKVDEEKSIPVYAVQGFKEKPDVKLAEDFLKDGHYLWNLGLFAASFEVFEKSMRINAPQLHSYLQILINDANRADENYLKFEIPAIEYALIEKDPDLLVVPGTFEWADIGSYFDLHKILKGKNSNLLKGDVEMVDCEDSMIHGTDKPIVAIGLSGIVVVDTPEGLLVCAKEKSQLVGEVVKKLGAKSQKVTD